MITFIMLTKRALESLESPRALEDFKELVRHLPAASGLVTA